jgi:indole-3-glycerol phosphate synthase
MSRQPKRDLRRKQRRQRKVRYLRSRLETTTDPEERQRLIAKIKKISPTAPVPEK